MKADDVARENAQSNSRELKTMPTNNFFAQTHRPIAITTPLGTHPLSNAAKPINTVFIDAGPFMR
jgi:hypothetical protein